MRPSLLRTCSRANSANTASPIQARDRSSTGSLEGDTGTNSAESDGGTARDMGEKIWQDYNPHCFPK